MPAWNWIRIWEDKKLEYALIDIKDELDDDVHEALMILQDNYGEYFGVNKKYVEYVQMNINLMQMKIRMALGEKHLKLMIQVQEIQINERFKQNTEGGSSRNVMALWKFFGSKPNLKEMSVYEYETAIRELERHITPKKTRAA